MSIFYCKEPFFITTSTDTWVHFNANGLLTERKRASYLCYFYVTAKFVKKHFGNCFFFVILLFLLFWNKGFKYFPTPDSRRY